MTIISKINIEEFQQFGATKLSGFLSDLEITEIESSIDDVAEKPSPMVDIFEKDSSGKTIFFNDFNNWRRIESLKKICFNPKFGNAFKLLSGSLEAYFFHDHVICKRAGAAQRTPWHIDKTYFMLDSLYTASFWIPTIDLTKDQSLSFAKGSHAERKLLMPKGFKSNNPLETDKIFLPFKEEDIEENYEIVNWDMKRGDVLVFTFYTVHSAPSCVLDKDRKALSLRLVGHDATFDSRVKNPAPPFTQMGYKAQHGDPIKPAWFPKY